jgi:transcriptional regulator with XRE-family HTH domain
MGKARYKALSGFRGGSMPKSLRSHRHKVVVRVLKAARQAAQLSQRDLALRLKRPHSYVARIETGQRRVDVSELCEIADALGIAPLDMFTRICTAF